MWSLHLTHIGQSFDLEIIWIVIVWWICQSMTCWSLLICVESAIFIVSWVTLFSTLWWKLSCLTIWITTTGATVLKDHVSSPHAWSWLHTLMLLPSKVWTLPHLSSLPSWVLWNPVFLLTHRWLFGHVLVDHYHLLVLMLALEDRWVTSISLGGFQILLMLWNWIYIGWIRVLLLDNDLAMGFKVLTHVTGSLRL